MTLDTIRPADGGGQGGSDVDVMASLWEVAPFARLPGDAPNELRHLVEDIENPKRVYAVHKASRRHSFQLLVQKYVVQLRDGCGADYCHTPTCFTCRKRIAGRAPIRRYNATSARTLAIYLASQDNPENGLCPTLKTPKGPPAAMSSLVFTSNPKQPVRIHMGQTTGGSGQGGPPRANGKPVTNGVAKSEPKPRRAGVPRDQDLEGSTEIPGFSVTERHESKDYRSFAANVFGTVAFKMLEWLTPSGVDDMSRIARSFQVEVENLSRSRSPSPASRVTNGTKSPLRQNGARPEAEARSPELEQAQKDTWEKREPEDQPQRRSSNPSNRPGVPRRNSNAKVRTPGPKAKRQLSIDPFPPEVPIDDTYTGLLKSPRLASQADKNSKGLKTPNSSLARPISQLSSAGFFDDVSLEKMPPKSVDIKTKPSHHQVDGARSSGSASPKEQPASSSTPSDSNRSPAPVEHESDSGDERELPQALPKLDADVVDFLCDILQDDHTNEKHMLEPPTIGKFHNRTAGHAKPLKRKSRSRRPYPKSMKLEWKLFIEQTFFYILSDAQPLMNSFVKKGQLYDSQTLWYCMLRMTRVAPTLVLHSLWMASAGLFAPPKSLQSLRSPTAKLFPRHEKSLPNKEAGFLLSICLHALVAAAPLVTNPRDLYDMSRIRSHGLSLAGSGAVARQPSELCLQYDDAFTNDLALRLARRLFAAITTRRYFDEMNDSNLDDGDDKDEPDVLAPLFSQLDFLDMDAAYILNFSFPDRALHETRVPTLLLDWARAVMLSDWDGNPVVPGDGPFGGALALIEAMYKKRQALVLGDSHFRSEYFAERLDTVQMPVAWLSHTSTRQKMHLLDFPYIFSQSTLVSYFRSINFSRMSRAFEESSSLQSRMQAIVAPKSLIVNQHHKDVLQDLLKTASSRYLILEINRDNVITDAFDQLWRREERELMRPLKVHLGESDGEEGFDSGGVQQEFFRLAVSEALDPNYGAFTVDDRTRMTWFQPGSCEPEWKFELVGLLVSLALYNGLTLPITLPKAFYRKLLGEPVTELHHIADGWPDLASGLTKLVEWDEKDGLVEDVFARTYEFSVSMFGFPVTREMKPAPPSLSGTSKEAGDDSWPQFGQNGIPGTLVDGPEEEAPLVTKANRNAYVSDYIRYLTDVSVRPQFEAFARGFRTCLHPKSLTLLTAPLLQSLVEGVQEIDIAELKRYARYVGWDASHRTVRDFWSIVRKYDDTMKRKLLEFVTASDRVPVGGIKNLQFVVQKNGEEEGTGGHLPTAYTCYGTLLLPEYRDKEVLRERMAMALENAQGFGFA
ncbi:hypothetical protein GQ53DRAFT_809004 [Thozetella sp. PMI_491]|nr:hypothetical protein GQ53DRAFT_809004 [Thozetella sp. PMI_491]